MSFLAEQLGQVALRTWLVFHGLAAAVAWALFFVCWTLLTHAGFAWIGWTMLVLYVVIAAPFLIIQAVMIADLLAYAVIGQTFAFSAIDKAVADFAKAHPERAKRIPWHLQIVFFAADASPISSMALCALVVLKRMPMGAHGTFPVQELWRQEIALERVVYARATQRFRLAPT